MLLFATILHTLFNTASSAASHIPQCLKMLRSKPRTVATLAFAHCKKRLAVFPSPAGMSLTMQILQSREKLNYSRPERVWYVTYRLGTGKSITWGRKIPYNLFLQYSQTLEHYRLMSSTNSARSRPPLG